MVKKTIYINKDNYNRIILTETIPYEVPIIFNNEGLYNQLNLFYQQRNTDTKDTKVGFIKKMLTDLILKKGKPTKPFFYNIRKNELEFRRLALLHPASQCDIKDFYQEYDQLVIYFCSQSPASLRCPKSVASKFYINNPHENKFENKTSEKILYVDDPYTKHMISYFTYHGYTRLYKFYNSKEYFDLEKRFPIQMTLDVSKCFDSIYTHSIGWATKSKDFVKNNLHKSYFGDIFDKKIRYANDNETKGIVIGPEISRIFAEIIFQKIDVIVINNLKNKKFDFDLNYTFKRYVDDVFIFAFTEEIAKTVYSEYIDVLYKFNLQVNTAKTLVSKRPFTSKKTYLIHEIKKIVGAYFDKTEAKDVNGNLALARILHPEKFLVSFISEIKNLCMKNGTTYAEIASYTISALKVQLYKLTKIYQTSKKSESVSSPAIISDTKQNKDKNYYETTNFIIRSAFFLYSVASTVNSSYTLSLIIIHMINSVAKSIPSFEEAIKNQIYHLTCQLFLSESQQQSIAEDKVVYLELLNIMLVVRNLGDQYRLPENIIENLFLKNNDANYFSIICILYYIKEEDEYSDFRSKIINCIDQKLRNLEDLHINSEKFHLLLDSLSCPYIPVTERQEWLKLVMEKINYKSNNITDIIKEMESSTWFVDWGENVNLLNYLVKKRIRQVY